MAASITIVVEDQALAAGLKTLSERGANLDPVMAEIGAVLLASTQQRFETETGPEGKSWPKSLRARLENGQTLSKSNRLRLSLTYRASKDAVEVGTNVIYAAIHQFGGRITAKSKPYLAFRLPGGGFIKKKSVTIPARPFLGIDAGDRAEIAAILSDYLEGAA